MRLDKLYVFCEDEPHDYCFSSDDIKSVVKYINEFGGVVMGPDLKILIDTYKGIGITCNSYSELLKDYQSQLSEEKAYDFKTDSIWDGDTYSHHLYVNGIKKLASWNTLVLDDFIFSINVYEKDTSKDVMKYEVSFIKNGVGQANIYEAPDERWAERIFWGTNINKDVELIGIREAVTSPKPGQPVISIKDLELRKINNVECRIYDIFTDDNEDQYVFGAVDEDINWFMVDVNPGKANHASFEYDHLPSRIDVASDYLDLESQRALDRYDEEYGADGWRVFPHLNDEKPEEDTTEIIGRRGRRR